MNPQENIAIGPLTTLGVGGPARYFVEARDLSSLFEALIWAREQCIPVRILGGGSNLLVADAGFDGLVIRVGWRGVESQERGEHLEAEVCAGEPWDEWVAWAVSRGWGGLECLSGIPGLVGAIPIQNVGAYGHEAGERIVSVRVVDRENLNVFTWTKEECAFGYRDSVFKREARDRYVVLSVRFRLSRNMSEPVRYPELARELANRGLTGTNLSDIRETVLALRRSKSMVVEPGDENARSCGSFFLNPHVSPADCEELSQRLGNEAFPQFPQLDGRIKLSAAWLIQRAGFERGARSGKVGLSTRHTLAVVCHDGASASEVWQWAGHIRQVVGERLGIWLDPEPELWPAREGWPSLARRG